ALVGMTPGETKQVEPDLADDATTEVELTLKEIKEKVLPPVDDDLARAATEFDTLADLRADIEGRLRRQLDAELEADFRAAAVDALVDASHIEPAAALVDARTNELLMALIRSLERRGISPETYLAVSDQTPEQLQERLRAEAQHAVSRELALEAVADRLGLTVSDAEPREVVRAEAGEAREGDPEGGAGRGVADRRGGGRREDRGPRDAP